MKNIFNLHLINLWSQQKITKITFQVLLVNYTEMKIDAQRKINIIFNKFTMTHLSLVKIMLLECGSEFNIKTLKMIK